MKPVNNKPKTKSLSSCTFSVLLVAFLCTAGVTAFLTFVAVRDYIRYGEFRSFSGLPFLGETISDTGLPTNLKIDGNAPLQPEGGPEPVPWDGNSRIFVLVMGLDHRDWEVGEGAPRTDTMILFMLDPTNRVVGILSIPRDLWVDIPGFEASKINTAYRLGELYDVPGFGPGLAMRTVEKLLDVPIDYYAQVDFNAFERFIDEIGGVKLDIPEKIEVDPLGDNNGVVLRPGVQVLSGSLALAYARARNTSGSDFDRAQRQQQVILGIRNRLVSPETLKLLINKSPKLYGEISAGIRTNMTLFQIIQLAWVAQQIPNESIKRAVIDANYVVLTTSFDGQSILVPMMEEIRALRDQTFSPTGAINPVREVSSVELVKGEAAKISVLNGTNVPGLASSTSDYLASQGLNVEAGNAPEFYIQTTIIDYTGKPATVAYLVELMNISANNIFHRYDPYSQVDVVLLLGDDWANNNPMP